MEGEGGLFLLLDDILALMGVLAHYILNNHHPETMFQKSSRSRSLESLRPSSTPNPLIMLRSFYANDSGSDTFEYSSAGFSWFIAFRNSFSRVGTSSSSYSLSCASRFASPPFILGFPMGGSPSCFFILIGETPGVCILCLSAGSSFSSPNEGSSLSCEPPSSVFK